MLVEEICLMPMIVSVSVCLDRFFEVIPCLRYHMFHRFFLFLKLL